MKFILYCRKSTDDRERQILSIQSQIDVLKEIADREGLEIVHIFEEAKSAKAPGREKFNEMLSLIEKGEAQGILCWKLDRLARNPVDEGCIKWLLQKGVIQKIITPDRRYEPADNVLITAVEFGMANQYIKELSAGVKRGLNDKAKIGWRPGRAPLGYLNSRSNFKGEQTILTDPERFTLVRKMFEFMLSGNYSVAALLKKITDELGLMARMRKSIRPLHLGELYRILGNPFYYGVFEWPKNSGNWIKGKHEPIITEQEFDRIQQLLGRKGNARPKSHQFAFTGLMRCLWCDSSITAETKIKKQKNGNTHNYVYYHCTKKKDRECPEKSIELKEFNRLVDEALGRIHIPDQFRGWAMHYAEELSKGDSQAQFETINQKRTYLIQLTQQIESLTLGFYAPENAQQQNMSKDEFQKLKGDLTKKKVDLETSLAKIQANGSKALEFTERTFDFVAFARYWFKNGSEDMRRSIFSALGSNLLVSAQKIIIEYRKPFKILLDSKIEEERELWMPFLSDLSKLELDGRRFITEDFSPLRKEVLTMSG